MREGILRRVTSGAVVMAGALVTLYSGLAGTGLGFSFPRALVLMLVAGAIAGGLLRTWRELWVVPAASAIFFATLVAWQRLVVEPRSALRPVEMWWQLQWALQVVLFTPPTLLGAAVALLIVRRVLRPR